jgi:GNAT superfamily N-acetyltransferase
MTSVAEVRGTPVGAAWLRFFPAHDPGCGFIDERIELSIGVVEGWRGRGVGVGVRSSRRLVRR